MDVFHSGQKKLKVPIKEKQILGLRDHEKHEAFATVELHREDPLGLSV